MPTHYATLKVAPTASIEDIKKSYRKLSLEHHPDRVNSALRTENSDLSEEQIQIKIADATKKFQEIGNAYKTLSEPESRRRYDDSQVFNEQRNTMQRDSWCTTMSPEQVKLFNKIDKQDEFLKACCDGDLARVTSFLNDPDINPNGIRYCCSPYFDDTCLIRSIPLQEAVIRKHQAIIIVLLAHPQIHAEVVEQNRISYGWRRAGKWWGTELMKHIPDTRTPLKIAAKENNVEIVNLILRHYIMQMASNNCSVNRLLESPRYRKSTLLHELAKYRPELWAQLQALGREQGHDWYLEILTKILDSEGKVPAQQHPLHLVFTTSPLKRSLKSSFFTLPDVISQIKTAVPALQQLQLS